MNVIIREIKDIPSLEHIIDLEILVWGLADRDAVPSNVLHPIILNGGLVLAAYMDDDVVGLSFAFPTRTNTLWSHITGIHPDYRSQGIGHLLKQHQREWARQQGYKAIHWTYDPLQRRNAHFNLNVLGARAIRFYPDFYGQMRDSINAGLPSDRLELSWPVSPPRKLSVSNTNSVFLLARNSGYEPELSDLTALNGQVNIEIPFDINTLKKENLTLAQHWSATIRTAFTQALANGYEVTGFTTIDDRCWYNLAPPTPWYLYVVRCQDESLYTGIATDVQRRIQQHNAGKGANYTASRRPVELLRAWKFSDQSSALKAEVSFKRLSRPRKLAHLKNSIPFAGGQPWTP